MIYSHNTINTMGSTYSDIGSAGPSQMPGAPPDPRLNPDPEVHEMYREFVYNLRNSPDVLTFSQSPSTSLAEGPRESATHCPGQHEAREESCARTYFAFKFKIPSNQQPRLGGYFTPANAFGWISSACTSNEPAQVVYPSSCLFNRCCQRSAMR